VSSYTNLDIEILISTMNKKSLDFLIPMFPFSHYSNFSILIVNQTQEDYLLTSDYPNIRVINSFEKGLSKSRNVAIQNATKQLCLIADDDIIYFSDFEKEIVNAFNTFSDASIITFNHQRIGVDKPYKSEINSYLHNEKSIYRVVSIEIAFKVNVIQEQNIKFDEIFGLGSIFETAEEFLFLRQGLKLNSKLYFWPSVIVSHPLKCSGEYHADDRLVFARSALFYKIKGNIAYLWLVKYLFFLIKNESINFKQCITKFRIGLLGIKRYKEIIKR